MSQRESLTGAISWMARNPVAANLAMVATLAAGLLGLSRVKQEVFPDFETEQVVVTVPYPGASPVEVEQGIILAIEEEVRALDGVKRVNSISRENVAQVMVELLLGSDTDKALSDVKTAVDRITSFPEEAERPSISMAQRRREVISLVLYGDHELKQLHALAEEARSGLLARPEITQVELFGVRPLEVSVNVTRQELEAYGLSLDAIANQIRQASIELPSGGVQTTSGEVLVRVADRKTRQTEFEDIVIRGTQNGTEVRLGALADIADGYEDTDQASYFNGKPAVRLTAYRIGDETPIQVAGAVRAFADSLKSDLPENVEVAIWADDSEILAARIKLLTDNARVGLVLVLVVLALFLQLRLAFWVALGIPISFLGALAVMPALGLSINMVTLFAFIVTLGMVVDDAIVVGENVYQKMQKGIEPLTAAIDGAREMAMPVSFSILTTIAAFAPMLLVPGFMGKIFGLIPSIVVAVLVFSLFESFFILPAHLGHLRAARGEARKNWIQRFQERCSSGLERFVETTYRRWLIGFLRHRDIAITSALALFVVTVSLVTNGVVSFSFFPRIEGSRVTATARLPYGVPIEATDAIKVKLEESVERTIEALGGPQYVRGVFARLGEAGGGHSGPERGSHLVSVEVNLVPSGQRSFTASAFSAKWKEETPPLVGIESFVINHTSGPGSGSAVDVQLQHYDRAVLEAASHDITEELRKFAELTNVENSFSAGKRQLDFRLRPEAQNVGVTATDVARQLRSAFYGAEAAREQRGRNEVKVMVRLPEEQRRSQYDIGALQIRTPQGSFVPLGTVATFKRGKAPTEIRREEGQRIINVRADLEIGVPSPGPVLSTLGREVFPQLSKKYPGLDVQLVGEQRNQSETFSSLGQNYLFALLLIFALLAIPFKSYFQPLVVMAAIPFGFVGAIWGHVLMGYGLSIISGFGIVALSGVVVNDSLVLVDAANKLRRAGSTAWEAIVEGGVRRFRPILLTSLTTFFGLAPMITETSLQARFLIPMAISLGFGVLFATVIVLLLVPCLYLLLEDAQDYVATRWPREAEPVVPPPYP